MPLVVKPARRGKGEGIRQKKLTELTTHRQKTAEIKSFLSSVGLRFPQTQQEVRLLYKEIGSFLAASVFLARTPAIVLDLPEKEGQDTKEQMRFRANLFVEQADLLLGLGKAESQAGQEGLNLRRLLPVCRQFRDLLLADAVAS
jgi:hypothetical protein